MRKQSTPANNNQSRTPAYFSTMKHEKEAKAMEQKQLMQQHGVRIPGAVSNLFHSLVSQLTRLNSLVFLSPYAWPTACRS